MISAAVFSGTGQRLRCAAPALPFRDADTTSPTPRPASDSVTAASAAETAGDSLLRRRQTSRGRPPRGPDTPCVTAATPAPCSSARTSRRSRPLTTRPVAACRSRMDIGPSRSRRTSRCPRRPRSPVHAGGDDWIPIASSQLTGMNLLYLTFADACSTDRAAHFARVRGRVVRKLALRDLSRAWVDNRRCFVLRSARWRALVCWKMRFLSSPT